MDNVILAEKSGFCFGVKRAVEGALKVQKEKNKKIYTLGPLIHNKDVTNKLQEENIYPILFKDINMLQKGDTVIIRSHGVSKVVMEELMAKDLDIVDNTCPYVKYIHNKVEKYYNEGYTIVIVGDESHPEVVGINGWCNNNAIILKEGYVKDKLPNKLCIVAQTTEKKEHLNRALLAIAETAKEFIVFNTICNATTERQDNARKLSQESEAMIVIGDVNSSNTNKLFEISKENCSNTYLVENLEDLIKQKDLLDFEGLKVGVTAGASTPDWVINKVISELKGDNHNGK